MALANKAGLPRPGFCPATTYHHTNPAPIEPTSAFWAILAVKRTSVSRIKSVLLIPTSNSLQDDIELPRPPAEGDGVMACSRHPHFAGGSVGVDTVPISNLGC